MVDNFVPDTFLIKKNTIATMTKSIYRIANDNWKEA